MVRVGGGWIALDEFLLKNDPCRGKLCIPQSYFDLSTNKKTFLNFVTKNKNF